MAGTTVEQRIVMIKKYRAALSQSQDRKSWAVIFRHPLRFDRSGQPGLRVRRGLGEQDREKAQRLVDQLNMILKDPSMWNPSSRPIAERQFSPQAVSAFYDKLPGEDTDFAAIVEDALKMPTRADGYRFVLLVGATASGKTTFLRQIIGTHPLKEKFPSTAPGRTTVAEMEFILCQQEHYEAAVTFLSKEEVRDHVEDCLCAAGLAVFRDTEDEEIYAKLLVHIDERFRLSYILGHGISDPNPPASESGEFEIEPDKTCTPETSAPVLKEVVARLRTIVNRNSTRVKADLGPTGTKADEQAAEDLVEQALDQCLRADPEFGEAAKSLLAEVVKRTEWLGSIGKLHKSQQGWPQVWSWQTTDRKDFIRKLSRLTSNHHRWHGTLLTPIVTGLRIKGPFKPSFLPQDAPVPNLVVRDGEGLGHITESAATVPNTLIAQFSNVDIVLLVDNAAHRMLAGPTAVLRALATSGYESKLALCFTHFDHMKADNLPNIPSRCRHIFTSVEQVLRRIGEEIGPSAERSLRNSALERRYYLSNIDQLLDESTEDGRFTIEQFKRLLLAIETKQDALIHTDACPVYEITKLVTGVQRAIVEFHEDWTARFGIGWKKGVGKEHWTRIRALARRCANNSDHYDTLNPGSDLSGKLRREIRTLFENPKRWERHFPQEKEADAKKSKLAQEVSHQVPLMVDERMYGSRRTEWGKAYGESGTGSASRRANLITGEIYTKAAPTFASTDQERLLVRITEMLKTVARKEGAELV